MKTLPAFALAAALSAALPASAALAETISLSTPLSGATLHSDTVHLSAYFIEAEGGAFEVVATYADDAAPYQPGRLVMALQDGDQTRFGLPGYPDTLYAFSRDGGVVSISDRPTSQAVRIVAASQAAR